MFRHLPLMIKNAARNRRRSVLTVCSVAASLCLLGVLMAIYHAFFLTPATPEGALRLITRNRISLTNIMPISYKQKIEKVPGVRAVTVMQWFGGVYKDPKNMFGRLAVEPDYFWHVYPEYKLVEGAPEQFQQERSACIIGAGLARKYDLKIGDRMTLVGDIFPITIDFTVRGIYDYPPDNENMFFSVQYLFESLPSGRRDFAGMFAIMVDSPEHVQSVSQAIDDTFRNSPVQTLTETEQAFQLGFISFLGNVKAFLASICAAVTFTILLVTANTMAMSVRERVREVGILKTLGYTNGTILGIVLGEAAFLSLIGGIVGLVLAQALTAVIRQAPLMIGQFTTLTIVPSVAGALLIVAVIIGVGSSFVPAWNASRTNILDSLRYTG